MSVFTDFCDHNLDGGSITGFEHKYTCPYCGAVDKLWVNSHKDVFICYRCGEAGSGVKLVAYLRGVTFAEAKQILGSGDSSVEDYNDLLSAWMSNVIEDEPVSLDHITPQGLRWFCHVPQFQWEQDIGTQAAAAVMNRGFTPQHLIDFCCGYFVEGVFANRVMLPVYKEGRFVYFQAWDYGKRSNPKFKYLNPKNIDVPFGKSRLIYNLDRWRSADTLVIVEGVFNAWAVEQAGYPAIATFGKSLSVAQLSQIVSHPAQRVIIGLDQDAHTEARAAANTLRAYGKDALLAEVPTSADWNDMPITQRTCVVVSASKPHWLF